MTFKHKLSRRLAAMWPAILTIAFAACGEAPTEPGAFDAGAGTVASALPANVAIGTIVQAPYRVRVRRSGSHYATTIGTQMTGARGVVTSTPTVITRSEPYAYIRVDWTTGTDGWTRTDELNLVSVPAPAPVAVASVILSPASVSLVTGATATMSISIRDANGNTLTGRTVTWASLNTGVATVSSTGVVTAVSAGTVLVSARVDGITGSATVVVTAPAPPPPPPVDTTTAPVDTTTAPQAPQAMMFSSDWSTGLGTLATNLRDGTRWSMLGGQGLEVISAAGLDFPTANVLRVTAVGATTGYAFLRRTGLTVPNVGESRFYRWYIRQTHTDNLEDGESHPIQDGNAASQSNWLFHVYHNEGGAGRWRPQFRAAPVANAYPNDRWFGPVLEKHRTYRFELQVQRTGATTFRMHARIFNSAGTQIASDADFRNQNNVASFGTTTFTLLNPTELGGLNAGLNGIAGNPTWPFIYGYQGGFAICTSDWCGPYRSGEGR